MPRVSEFPFLFRRGFIEARPTSASCRGAGEFPFLFGRAFIEALARVGGLLILQRFPFFSEGLSLRRTRIHYLRWRWKFPFLFGRAFIEVFLLHSTSWVFLRFLTETFIEASHLLHPISQAYNISLPFL